MARFSIMLSEPSTKKMIKSDDKSKVWPRVLGWIFLALGIYSLPAGLYTLISLLKEIQRIHHYGSSLTSGTNIGMGVGIGFPLLFISFSLIIVGLMLILKGKNQRYRFWFISLVAIISTFYLTATIWQIGNYGHELSNAYEKYTKLDEDSLLKIFEREARGNNQNKVFAVMQVLAEKKSAKSIAIFEEIIEKRKFDQIWVQAVYWLPKLDKERGLSILNRIKSDSSNPDKQRVAGEQYKKALSS